MTSSPPTPGPPPRMSPQRVVVIGPDGQPVGTIPADMVQGLTPEDPDDEDGDGNRQLTDLVEQPAKVMRIGSMIRQLLEEVKAAPLDEASRAPPQGDPPGLHQGARERPGSGAGRGARAALAALHRRRHPQSRASCGSPRPSSWAGSRGCSTASRPRSTPSRWPPGPSSSRCAAPCRPGCWSPRPTRPASRLPGRPGQQRGHVPLRRTPGQLAPDLRRTSARPSSPMIATRSPGGEQLAQRDRIGDLHVVVVQRRGLRDRLDQSLAGPQDPLHPGEVLPGGGVAATAAVAEEPGVRTVDEEDPRLPGRDGAEATGRLFQGRGDHHRGPLARRALVEAVDLRGVAAHPSLPPAGADGVGSGGGDGGGEDRVGSLGVLLDVPGHAPARVGGRRDHADARERQQQGHQRTRGEAEQTVHPATLRGTPGHGTLTGRRSERGWSPRRPRRCRARRGRPRPGRTRARWPSRTTSRPTAASRGRWACPRRRPRRPARSPSSAHTSASVEALVTPAALISSRAVAEDQVVTARSPTACAARSQYSCGAAPRAGRAA